MKQVMKTNYIRGTIVSFIVFAKRFSIFAALLTFALLGDKLTAKNVILLVCDYLPSPNLIVVLIWSYLTFHPLFF